MPIASPFPVFRSAAPPVGGPVGLGVAFLTGAFLIAWACGAGAADVRHGTWQGLPDSIAPGHGQLAIEGTAGGEGGCELRGESSSSSGNGWSFRGRTRVRETACVVQIAPGGAVAGELTLRMEWRGRMKGIGGDDGDEIEGFGVCTGPLVGSRDGVGSWQGACENAQHRWTTRFDWIVDAQP